MKFNILLVVLIITILASNCRGLSEKKVIGNYYLIAADGDRNAMTLSYKLDANDSYIGIISETVVKIGFNDNYIIAQQHPRSFPNEPNKSITNFYILPIRAIDTFYPAKSLFGPYNESKFNSKRKELDIPDSLHFSITIK